MVIGVTFIHQCEFGIRIYLRCSRIAVCGYICATRHLDLTHICIDLADGHTLLAGTLWSVDSEELFVRSSSWRIHLEVV
ncbi:hypothetical protein D3C73_670970 [compost metagenome]